MLERVGVFSADRTTLQCMVTNLYLPETLITAGHVISKKNAAQASDWLQLHDINVASNGVLWCEALEVAWSKNQICFTSNIGAINGQVVMSRCWLMLTTQSALVCIRTATPNGSSVPILLSCISQAVLDFFVYTSLTSLWRASSSLIRWGAKRNLWTNVHAPFSRDSRMATWQLMQTSTAFLSVPFQRLRSVSCRICTYGGRSGLDGAHVWSRIF